MHGYGDKRRQSNYRNIWKSQCNTHNLSHGHGQPYYGEYMESEESSQEAAFEGHSIESPIVKDESTKESDKQKVDGRL